ncbi:phosphonopyruvate decarboxylase [Actinoplanes sp. ATCC 53533]|uniref:phosphonopyruvate decarboxylase n=1 Tax=Actinoplanes sp. ATCC 53533 TaxID=1288362 RepID=UPI000F77672E|nr:phosphonopyruvate decarboxylase [Actinoplanes sp. ATCC 53533]RSM71794.1 phosphonopyruvate decarboxylase [Actinoplanes sp. ATCC 53533]
MTDATTLLRHLVDRGANFFTGVPCSHLDPLLSEVHGRPDVRYVPASSEGESVALCAGTWLTGGLGVVMCQNSGLGNMVNPLTSLSASSRIPCLLIVSWRGEPGRPDEPQHELMGRMTPGLLDLMEIDWRHLPSSDSDLPGVLDEVFAHLASTRRPYAILVRAGDLTGQDGGPRPDPAGAPAELPSRHEALTRIAEALSPEAVVVATTGKCGRELSSIRDRERNFYCVGAMGYANAIAHGVALGTSEPVYVLDGDGALLMHLGNLSTIGATAPPALTHIVLDNGSYDSTGGQATAAGTVDFTALARACGYSDAVRCEDLDGLTRHLGSRAFAGPTLLHLRIRPGSVEKLGRPDRRPPEIAERLKYSMSTRRAAGAPATAPAPEGVTDPCMSQL